MTALVCWLALWRYRAAVPLVFTLLLLQFVAALLLRVFHPFARVGSPPAAYVNVSLLVLLAVGCGLSLWKRKDVSAS